MTTTSARFSMVPPVGARRGEPVFVLVPARFESAVPAWTTIRDFCAFSNLRPTLLPRVKFPSYTAAIPMTGTRRATPSLCRREWPLVCVLPSCMVSAANVRFPANAAQVHRLGSVQAVVTRVAAWSSARVWGTHGGHTQLMKAGLQGGRLRKPVNVSQEDALPTQHSCEQGGEP
jgi:hypothetical protein